MFEIRNVLYKQHIEEDTHGCGALFYFKSRDPILGQGRRYFLERVTENG